MGPLMGQRVTYGATYGAEGHLWGRVSLLGPLLGPFMGQRVSYGATYKAEGHSWGHLWG